MTLRWKILLPNLFILSVMGLFIFMSSPVYATITQTDIISFWTLDDTVAGTYSDAVGSNDGAGAAQNPTPETNGKINGAQVFDGDQDGINIPDDDTLDWAVGDSFSIELWMKGTATTGDGGTEVMIGRDDAASSLHWWIGVLNGGNVSLNLYDTDGGGDEVVIEASPAVDVRDGEWHHIVGVRDVDTNKVRFYVDGVQTSADESFSAGFDSADKNLNIGWLNLGASFYYFNGTLDEVALYNKALTATEVQAHLSAEEGPRYFVQSDTDGVSDGVENAGPNSGDGNDDGTPDMNQDDVASFLTKSGTDYVTIATSAGTLAGCQAVDNPSSGDAPSDTTFDWGFFNFTINGTSSATVTLTLPTGAAPDTYYKYGPPTPGESDAWYEFADDGTTGATISSNIVTLKFVDGDRGDDTGVDNSIVDQGGPATVTATTPTPTPTPTPSSDGGGGGCFISTAANGSL